MAKNIINHIDTYNDHSRSVTINGANTNVADLIRSFMAEDVTPEPSSVSPESNSGNTRGPKTQFLFADEYGRENVKRSQEEAERVADYIADHRMGQMRLDSKRTNKLNLMVACFWYRWDEHKWVNSIPQGAAIYRFFTDYCKLPCDVQPRAFMNVICALINEGKKDPEIYDNLCGYFPQ